MLPEYLVEFEYVQKNPYKNKVYDFGDLFGIFLKEANIILIQIGYLDSEDSNFYTGIQDLKAPFLRDTFRELNDIISNYDFKILPPGMLQK